MATHRLRRDKTNPAARSYSYAVGIPRDMGEILESNGVEAFTVEFHEEGVLLRPQIAGRSTQDLPAWIRNGRSLAERNN